MKIQKQFKVAAIIIIIIGVIHTAATPLVLSPFKVLSKSDFLTFVYMFVVTGLAVLLNGLIQFLIVKHPSISKLNFSILKYCVIFMLCISVGAIVLMYDSFNPFAYIMLITGFWELILLKKLKNFVNG
jgi:hypothetical protein